ncbi:hypothetical protein [Streptomyces poriticola]|uniref:hypothetical protein n=1 Tax=Streptomyces poriticola TaxID=3120506 RepID=UPI002FCE1FAF
MGTKTVDETGVKTDETKAGRAGEADEATVTAVTADPAGRSEGGAAGSTGQDGADDPAAADAADDADVMDDADDPAGAAESGAGGQQSPTGVGQGAGAVVAAALGLVSLTGSWIGTVASARQSLIGQLESTSSSDFAQMIEKGYGDAWQATALWGGLFALTALIVGVAVLARPAFGVPGPPQAPWIKSVAWAGVALGVVGLLLAVLKYTGILLGLPSTG